MDTTQIELFDAGANDDGLLLADYAEQAYLDYAVSVVKGRALPEVADGQKPVQRRILYAMRAMGLAHDARPVKSARVVGDVLGKYHPHGDQAAYEAMVRMAQDFTLRYPLIDGHGNFGSRDGDNAAAMRYTEARLTAFASVLLDELDEGTVDFLPNYDGSQREPQLLPARLPVVLLNGASGIAVGLATEIPSHNLREIARACVALLKTPTLSDAALFDLVPGPDFSGGGQIISAADEIGHVYESGRGSIKVRARWRFEEMARGQWQWVVTELPPGVSARKILEEVEDRTNPKLKAGRKSLTAEQQQCRALVLGLLDTVRDESGKQAPVRLVFEPKTSRIDRNEFVTTLLAQTSMETSVAINLVCIGADSRPGQRGLRRMLEEWLRFRARTLTRRTRFRFEKASDRIHVLEGRMVVYLNVERVVETIREAEEPRVALMRRFDLSERQADDILDMRLRQLARLEGFKIEKELTEKKAERGALEELLNSPAAFRRMTIREIEADAKRYGDERRTLIEPAERAVLETRVVDEPVTVVISQKGWVRARQGHEHDPSQFGFKPGDGLYDIVACRSVDDLVALCDNGRVHTVPVANLPSARGDGQPVNSLTDIAPGAHVAHMVVGAAGDRYVVGTRGGYGFLATVGDMTSRQRAGKQFVTVGAGDALLRPLPVRPSDRQLALLTRHGRFLVIDLDELKSLPSGGRGTVLMGVDGGDALAQWVCVGSDGISASGVYRKKETSLTLDTRDLADYVGRRARKGKLLAIKIKYPVLSPR